VPTSDEDLRKQADKVAKLREQLADARNGRVEREKSLANDATMMRLQAEEATLQAELERAKDSAKAGSVKESAAPILDAAAADLAAAKERQKAQAAASNANTGAENKN
jgi:hypothetical protein